MNVVLASLLCLSGNTDIEVGSTVDYTFEKPPINALGVKSFADLRGKPVLMAFFTSSSWADDWVDDVVVWQKEYGEDLAVVLSEIPSNGIEKLEATALERKWLGSRAMWTIEFPAYPGLHGIPQYTLVSSEGKVLMRGVSAVAGMNFLDKELDVIEDAIAEEVRRRRAGPDGAPKEIAAAYEAFAEGEIERALASARELSADADATLAEAARAAHESMRGRLAERLERAAALLAEGRLEELESELARTAGVAAEADLEERRAALAAELASDANAAEREASKALAKVLDKVFAKGPKTPLLAQLKKLAKKYAGTKSAAYAEHLMRLDELE